MAKAKSDENDTARKQVRNTDKNAAETDKESTGDDQSSIELEAWKGKKGEPSDNLRRRSEWFQKRTGGG